MAIRGKRARGDLRVVDRRIEATSVRPARTWSERLVAAVSGEDDRDEPGTAHATHCALSRSGSGKRARYRRHRFANGYTRADIALLASVDEAPETLSGPATRQILKREYNEYGDSNYARLAAISAAQIYRLRKGSAYRRQRTRFSKTRPTAVKIGERRRPVPEGRPGYWRVDTVHRGDREGVKGVYQINAVDAVAGGGLHARH